MWNSVASLRAARSLILRRCDFATKSGDSSPLQLNCARALVKAHETDSFQTILTLDVTTLQGIGPKHQEQLHSLRLKTVADLANYKFFHLARSIAILAETEEIEGRLETCRMNINKGVDKAYESQSLQEIVKAPVSALQGLTEVADETFRQLGVKSISDLGRFKYCLWSEAIQTAAKYEEEI